MERLVDDLLTLARSGESLADPAAVDLAAAVERSWRHVETAAATLELEAEPTRTIRADESRLRQLLANLLRNSVEHGSTSSRVGSDDAVEHGSTSPDSEARRDAVQHGGEGVTVRVGELDDGSGFYVADDGPGIPESDRERVFEAGYSTDPDGTGYGLSIVAEIADAHGWEIRLAEGTDGGARFEITGVAWADE